ncbi:hypothetical protein AB0D60_03565, partial [Streptomyces sp. NPDC048306]|uniref:hypothetical protein n=1 Tax=Streptomyces sp. NPDC048306 TaxID=3154502 RepID=UPI00340871C6
MGADFVDEGPQAPLLRGSADEPADGGRKLSWARGDSCGPDRCDGGRARNLRRRPGRSKGRRGGSFVLAAITCVFTAFSFAELGGAIPVSGSSYS